MRGVHTVFGRLALALVALSVSIPPLQGEGLGSRDSAQLTILHLADVYTASPVDAGKEGGLARVAALEKQLAAAGRNVLLTLGGDFLSPSVASSVFEGEQMIAAFGAIGLDLATLGNHEFDFGPEVLEVRMREAPWDWVVSNIVSEQTGEPVGGAAPFLVRQFGDLEVGFLGLCLIGEEISASRRQGYVFLDPFASAEEYIEVLEERGVDAIVALTHLDFADDARLARLFPQIDVILGGHEHFPIASHIERSLITKPGSDARRIARVDVSKPGPDAPVEKHFEMISIVEGMDEDADTLAVVAEWESQLDVALDQVVGSTTEPLNAVAEEIRSGESNLGNLMADAMRLETGADLAIVNSGSIRSNRIYPAGELTRRDLVAIHPFGGTVCEVEVTGREVLAALNNGFGRLGESVGRFPQLAGLQVMVDPSRPIGSRVVEASVGDQALDPAQRYRVAISDYMLEGGDGYSMFSDARVRVGPEEGELLVSTLEKAIRRTGRIAPVVEGRIRFQTDVDRAVGPRPIILDTDMGIDSVIGLLYLLGSSQVSVEAITLVHGVSDPRRGASNAVGILELTGNAGVPVAIGQRRPMEGARTFPRFWKSQANRLGGATLPAEHDRISRRGVELMLATLEGSAEKVTLVAMGPLTNIARALERKPEIVEKIEEIALMGGALDVSGNVGTPYIGVDNFEAEWNFYLDPHAAAQVLASGVKIRLMPLDATQTLPVTTQFVDRVKTRPRDQNLEFLLSILSGVRESIDRGYYYFWDVLAAVATARPEVLSCREERIRVVTEEGPELGRTVRDEEGTPVCVVEEIRREMFEDELLATLFD